MITNVGRDWQCGVMASTSSNGSGDYAPANYIALSADTGAPSAAHTTLTGELTGTLARAQGLYAHTPGAATYTLTKQFTSDQTVTVHKMGIFTADGPPPAGTMVFETVLDADASLKSGDTIAVVFTGTL